MQSRNAFSLVEILIVVMILGILAMVAVPKFAESTNDARDSALCTDLKAVRRQLEIYKLQHNGRGPEVNQYGALDTANMVNRMTGKTTSDGALSETGTCGPYLLEWPSNQFVDSSVAQSILFGMGSASPRSNATGWYYSRITGDLHVNSSVGAESVD